MEYITAGGSRPTAADWPLVERPTNSPARASLGSMAMPMCGSKPCTPPILEAPGAVEYATPSTATLDIDEEADEAPLRFSTMVDLMGATP
jgi:hypothetical protein